MVKVISRFIVVYVVSFFAVLAVGFFVILATGMWSHLSLLPLCAIVVASGATMGYFLRS